MKKYILIFGLLFGMIVESNAQLELSAMGGYFWGGKVKFYEGRFDMHDANDYLFTAATPTFKGNFVELSYSYTNSTARFNPYRGYEHLYNTEKGKLNTHYVMIGSYQQIETGGKVEPFIGLSLGTAIYDWEYATSNVWRFAAGLGGGLKVYLNDKIGLRFQGRLLMPMYFAGLGFYGGTGGAGMSLNAGIIAWQGDVSAGIILRLK